MVGLSVECGCSTVEVRADVAVETRVEEPGEQLFSVDVPAAIWAVKARFRQHGARFPLL